MDDRDEFDGRLMERMPETPSDNELAAESAAQETLVGEIDDIELAYQRALSAMEDLPWAETSADAAPPKTGEPPLADRPADGLATDDTNAGSCTVVGEAVDASRRPDAGHAPVPPSYSAALRLAPGTAQPSEESSAVTPAQVIEAALFVGGMPLSAAKIGALLRGAVENNSVEQTIDELNRQYIAEGRPYEIRLGDGGYRLELRPEFDKLRNRVYGAGPREVRLSQDALEVLALVAYQQPISQAQIEAHGKQQAGNVLRQLLRRELVAIERGPGGRKDIKYVTTARFLSVFGLGSLAELPEPEDLARR